MLIALDVFVSLILLAIPFFIFEVKRRKVSTSHQTFKQVITSNVWSIVISFLIGVFFIFTYLAYRYFAAPWTAFGFLHLYGMFMPFMLAFALAYLCKGTKQAKLVAIVMASLLALSPLTRPIFVPMIRTGAGGDMSVIANWDMAIPFNLCNISAIIFIIGILTKNKTIKNYMFTFGLFGAVINNLQAHNTHVSTFWYYLTWESYFVHYLIIIIPVFMLLTNQIKPNLKHTLFNGIWIFPFYVLAGFLINPLWKTNFHFTKPIAFTKAFMPMMSEPLQIFGQPVDPLYMTCFLGIVVAGCALFYGLGILVYKYLRPLFCDTNEQSIEKTIEKPKKMSKNSITV